jgi:branched-chain amino acid transport system permease protein
MSRRASGGVALVVLAVILAAAPFAASNYLLRVATIGFMYVALASSWNIIGGFAGYPSFATAAFFGLGAYTCAIIRIQIEMPLVFAWAAGAGVAALFALFLGLAILNLRGHYFAVASLVVAAVLREIVNSATTLTGGGMGLTLPASATGGVAAQAQLYYASMLAAAVVTVAAAWFIAESRFGWALRCIEQNEDAAIVLGIDTRMAKVAALVTAAVSAGLAGAIYATWIGYIDPTDVFDDVRSINPIVIAFLGGVGTVSGPVIGAAIFLFLEEFVWRNALDFHAGILGIIVVLLLVFLPGGLGSLRHARTWLRGRREEAAKSESKASPVSTGLSP